MAPLPSGEIGGTALRAKHGLERLHDCDAPLGGQRGVHCRPQTPCACLAGGGGGLPSRPGGLDMTRRASFPSALGGPERWGWTDSPLEQERPFTPAGNPRTPVSNSCDCKKLKDGNGGNETDRRTGFFCLVVLVTVKEMIPGGLQKANHLITPKVVGNHSPRMLLWP